MPSPVGHVLGAIAVRNLMLPDLSVGEAAVLGIAADVDFLAGIAPSTSTSEAHGNATHSLAGAAIAGALWGTVLARGRRRRRVAIQAAAAYASHLLLDALGKEKADGLPLTWPFGKRRFAFPSSLFMSIRRTPDEPLPGALVNVWNRVAIAREVRLLAPWLVASAWCRRRSKRCDW